MSIDSEEEAVELRQSYIRAMSFAHRFSATSLLDERVGDSSLLRRELAEIESGEEPDATRTVFNLGREAATKALAAGCHNLSAILRLNAHPDDDRPANLAIYPLARTVLEGSALAQHLTDPNADLNNRLLRTGQILTWSARQMLVFAKDLPPSESTEAVGLAEQNWSETTNLLAKAGIAFAGSGKDTWHKLSRNGAAVGKFEISNLVSQLHPDAKLGYRQLSGVAHHAPWMLDSLIRHTGQSNSGSYHSTDISDAEMLRLSANSCHALLLASTSRSFYHGSDYETLGNSASQIAKVFAELITKAL